VFDKVAERHPQHTFAKLDTLAKDELTSALEIAHVPTMLLYRDGLLLFKQAGNFDETRLEDIVAQAEALDMDIVRAEMARDAESESSPESE
jgi:thioredoxin 1